MPNSQMIYKAGKLSFLLVCLFLCTACGREKAAFTAGNKVVQSVKVQDAAETDSETQSSSVKQQTKKNETKEQIVNINTAGLEELMTLPGIGQVRAEAIIAYRQQEGNFETIEDIMNVKGIKTGVFSKINNRICVK